MQGREMKCDEGDSSVHLQDGNQCSEMADEPRINYLDDCVWRSLAGLEC